MSDPGLKSEPTQTGLKGAPIQTELKGLGASSPAEEKDGPASRAPSLALLYGLLVFALVLAIAFAWLILRPFHLGQ